ncbi:hypothetical protein GCM10010495_64550 [Kitasatospora herbaricolor]|nr:hypothetical protein GCM10010495_64550 [Kitasatospora herbaricolor]
MRVARYGRATAIGPASARFIMNVNGVSREEPRLRHGRRRPPLGERPGHRRQGTGRNGMQGAQAMVVSPDTREVIRA